MRTYEESKTTSYGRYKVLLKNYLKDGKIPLDVQVLYVMCKNKVWDISDTSKNEIFLYKDFDA